MNKQNLISILAKQAGISKTEASDFIEAFIITVKDGLKRGDKINISGLGTFMLLKRQAYIGKNPQTGEKIQIPEQIFPYFKPSGILKESIKKESK